MKFIEALQDEHGYHYVVQFDDGTTKPFNYSHRPVSYPTGAMVAHESLTIPDPSGETIEDPAGGTMPDPSGATFEDMADMVQGELEEFEAPTGRFNADGTAIMQKAKRYSFKPRVKPVQIPKRIPKMIPLLVPEFIAESEEQYRRRIESEIIEACKQIAAKTPPAELPVKGTEF